MGGPSRKTIVEPLSWLRRCTTKALPGPMEKMSDTHLQFWHWLHRDWNETEIRDQHLAFASKLACLEIWSQNTAPRSCTILQETKRHRPLEISWTCVPEKARMLIALPLVDMSGQDLRPSFGKMMRLPKNWKVWSWTNTDHTNEILVHLIT